MPFSLQETYHASVFTITGKFLGSLEGAAFKEKIDEIKKEGKTNVVVDLSKTDLMDSSGIGALIASLHSMRSVDGDIRLAGVEKRMRNLFLMTRLLGNVFDDYEDVDAAIESYREEEGDD